MKKRILAWGLAAMMVLAALSVTALAGEELVPLSTGIDITDSFTCPNFLAVVREITGVSEPNPIFSGHVNSIIEVHADFRDITSLAGIEHFAALEWIDVRLNQLTELDVSNNTALERLEVDANQLTELDVSNNTALEQLNVSRNQLTELDVSNNTALQTLGAWENQLTELNVSNNTALRSLSVQGNQLTELDVSNNTALGLLGLLGVEQNNMTSPDDVIGWELWFSFPGSAFYWDSPFIFYPQREQNPCPDCGALPCECNGFGPVPITGIPDISLAMYAMFALAALSAGLWASALRPKRRK